MSTSKPLRNIDLIPGAEYEVGGETVTFITIINYDVSPGRSTRKPLVRWADGRQGVATARKMVAR